MQTVMIRPIVAGVRRQMSSPQRSSETGCWPGCIFLPSPLPFYSCPQRLCTHRADWPKKQAAKICVKCSTITQTERERWRYEKTREEEEKIGRTRSRIHKDEKD